MLESKGAEIISLDEVITELKHGSNPNLEALTKQKGFDQLIIKKLTKLNEYPAAMLIAYKPFYIRNKELINSFIAEQNKVLESIKQNPQHALSSAQKHFKKVMQRDIEMDFLNTSFSKVKLADNDKDLSIDVLKDMMEISHHAKYIQEPRIKRLERNTKLIRE